MHESPSPPSKSYRAPAVSRAFGVLRLLAQTAEPLGVSELARLLGASKGSVHGVVKALLAEGAVEEVDGGGYRPGPLLASLAPLRGGRKTPAEACAPVLQRLARETGHTALYGVPRGTRLRIERVETGSTEWTVRAAPGLRIPLLAGAVGKVVMAWGGVPVPDEPRGFTPATLTDRAELLDAVEETRRLGYAQDRGEYLAGVAAVAAPILSEDDRLLGVLYAVRLLQGLGRDDLGRLGERVRSAADEVSSALRGSADPSTGGR